MQAEILGLVQYYSFLDDGSATNHLKLRLEDGTEIQAAVSEETALLITKSYLDDNRSVARATVVDDSYLDKENSETTSTFALNADEIVRADYSPAKLANEDLATDQPSNGSLPTPHWNNVRRPEFMDPGEMTDLDEDGVGSV